MSEWWFDDDAYAHRQIASNGDDGGYQRLFGPEVATYFNALEAENKRLIMLLEKHGISPK